MIKTAERQKVDSVAKGRDQVTIETSKGRTYVVTDIPAYTPVTAPSKLKIVNDVKNQVELSWTGSAAITKALRHILVRAVG